MKNILIKKWNKKAVSNIIGYLLLVAIVIVISMIVYQWLKTYVPTDAIQCDEGVSIGIDDYNYDCEDNALNLTIKNSGRFTEQPPKARTSQLRTFLHTPLWEVKD